MFEYMKDGSIHFYCPGCRSRHSINSTWTISNTEERPTVKPSVLTTWTEGTEKHRCHLFITDGSIQFLNDCTHDLKGKVVPMTSLKA